LSIWQGSTEKQDDVVGPPPPPPWKEPSQRRFDFMMIGLTIVLAAGLVGGLMLYSHVRDKRAAAAQTRGDVRQAYLGYYSALIKAAKELSVAALEPWTTPEDLKNEDSTIQLAIQSGHRYQVSADHDLQVMVYSGGDLASVDDVMLRHTVPLDPTTYAPNGPDAVEVVHEGMAFKKQAGRWLMDSLVGFGLGQPTADNPGISYAAANRGKPLAAGLRREIEQAYLRYRAVNSRAFLASDPGLLSSVEFGEALSRDTSAMADWKRQGLGDHIIVEHNYRIATRDSETAYVYDTTKDTSYLFKLATKARVPGTSPEVLRENYELKKVGGGWKVDHAGLNVP
jgi:hypothetical protein